MKMKGVRSSYQIRKTLVAGQALYYTPGIPEANVLLVYSHITGTVGISPHPDVDTRPLMTAPNGGVIPWVDPAGIGALYLYSAAGGVVDIMEYLADEVAMDINVTSLVGGINVNNFPAVQPISIVAGQSVDVGTVTTLPPIPAGANIIGAVGIDQTTPGTTNGVQVVAALPTGANNIGDVDVLSLPALPAGTNNIGDVDVLTLPAIPAGANIIGAVGIDQTTPGTTNGVQVVAALPAGANNIGDVDVLSLPALPAGTNNIGDVDVLTLPAITIAAGQVVETKPTTGIAPVKTNAPGAGEVTIKNAAGRVFSFTADVAGMLRDGTGNDVYITPAGVVIFPARPLEFATNIIWNASGAGNIYTQYE